MSTNASTEGATELESGGRAMIKRIERADGPRWQVYGRRGGKRVYDSTHDTQRAAKAADEAFRVRQRQIACGEGATGLVVAGHDPRCERAPRPRDKSSVFRPFKAAVVRAGLPKVLRIHDLRHTYASHYVDERRRHIQAVAHPRSLVGRDHREDLRAPPARRARGRRLPRVVLGTRGPRRQGPRVPVRDVR
jgi:integrase